MSPRPERKRPGSTSELARAALVPQVEAVQIGATASSTRPGPAQSQTPAVTDSVTTGATAVASTSPAKGEDEVPRYQTLVRKEARLRYDQVAELAALRRRLSTRRQDRSEMLTDNTLIRVAVDVLLAHAEELRGDTENELRQAMQAALSN